MRHSSGKSRGGLSHGVANRVSSRRSLFWGIRRDEIEDALRHPGCAVTTIKQAVIQAAVFNGTAGHGCRSDPAPCRMCLDGFDELGSVHAPIRDIYPLCVKRDICLLERRYLAG